MRVNQYKEIPNRRADKKDRPGACVTPPIQQGEKFYRWLSGRCSDNPGDPQTIGGRTAKQLVRCLRKLGNRHSRLTHFQIKHPALAVLNEKPIAARLQDLKYLGKIVCIELQRRGILKEAAHAK